MLPCCSPAFCPEAAGEDLVPLAQHVEGGPKSVADLQYAHS